MNYAIHESMGKWAFARSLAYRCNFKAVRLASNVECGLCKLHPNYCPDCLATGNCQLLMDELQNTLDGCIDDRKVLAAIDNILEYLEQLKAR